MSAKLSCKDYEALFKKRMKNKAAIKINGSDNLFVPAKDEKWVQCYSKSDHTRSIFPPSWFISDKGNLLRVKPNGLYLTKPIVYHNGYLCHKVSISGKDNKHVLKSITVGALVNICFSGSRFGLADAMLDEKGIFAFGTANVSTELNCHHINSKKTQNDPDNLQIMSKRMHCLLHHPEKATATFNEANYTKELSEAISQEAPDSISVVAPYGKEKYFANVNKLYFTQQGAESLLTLEKEYHLLMTVAKNLNYENGPRYLCTSRDGRWGFFKAECTDNSLNVTEVIDARELNDKDFVKCFYRDNQMMYVEG